MMKRVSVNGVSLSVRDEGSGVPIVFAHGFPLSHSMWDAQIEDLSADYRTIAPDLRGFGNSDVTAGTVTMEQFADDVAALLDELGVSEPVVFCGLSMGGYVAWQLFRRHRDRLRALILCDTRAVADSPEAVANREKLARLVLETGTEPVAAAMLPNLFSTYTTEQRAMTIDAARQVLLETDPRGIAAASLGMAARPDVSNELSGIDVPSLLIVGEEDRISPVDEMRAISDVIPQARLVVVSGAGHMAPLENPAEANVAIREFLAALS